MSTDRVICLANSYKHEHRCVAGISLVSKQWIRLIGRRFPGCLTIQETCYADGKEAKMLDVFEVEVEENCGSNSHPEDVKVSSVPWQFNRRFNGIADSKFLDANVAKGPGILQGCGDRVYAKAIAEKPVERSLELIHPEDLWWWIREEGGKRKNRALFRCGHVSRVRYDLAVTDPAWLDQLHLMPAGIYPHAFMFGGKPPKTYLTISLSEPFENFHYKIVAGVVYSAN